MGSASERHAAACGSAIAWAPPAYSQSNSAIYEVARLIVGHASAPIENGVFCVRNGHITAIGPKGSVKVRSGADRVDPERQDSDAGRITSISILGTKDTEVGASRTTRPRMYWTTWSAKRFMTSAPPCRWANSRRISRSSSSRTSWPGSFPPQPVFCRGHGPAGRRPRMRLLIQGASAPCTRCNAVLNRTQAAATV